ncbi:MAG: EscU/YscU/HrcU family type III secretion system export apparatus switch protein [Treponema sp.]|nr:EscU/YscU/HrcU family type III secretion system export apparatus switch protein [Spirochaetia bacterium]MDY3758895.1 EscU/YscU/HrcU family type III secretion system export apparatus switch protein [Treponema sp.]
MMKNSKFAVSLKYPENLCAPVITSKSSGIVAQRMIEIAEENGIPVVEDDVLANVLSIKQVGECIPESTWEAVASIFAFIKLMEERVK